MSWNKFYGGMHWTKRRDEAQRVHWLLVARTGSDIIRFKKKVNIIITVYFDKSPFDPDNIPSKLYIDGLRYFVLENDTHEWVDSVTTKSRIDKESPRVEIQIEEAL